jgi:prepilin-type processing-associated H-X9-DG protein
MGSSAPRTLLAVLLALPCVIFAFRSSQSDLTAKLAETRADFKQIALGTIMYATDYDDVLPYAQSTRAVAYVTEPYMKNRGLWRTLNPNGGKVQFNLAVGGVALGTIQNPADIPLFSESAFWPDGARVVAFVDGHVRAVAKSDWPKIQKALAKTHKRSAKPLPANYGSSFRFPDESPGP